MFQFVKRGMLTGDEIERQIKKGNILIDPYDPKRINPNSYNLCLHPQLLVYSRGSNRKYDIPTGVSDPVLDYIIREKARLGNDDINIQQHIDTDNIGEVVQKVAELNTPNKNDTVITEDTFSSTDDPFIRRININDSRTVIKTFDFNDLKGEIADTYVSADEFKTFKESDLLLNPIDMHSKNETVEFEIPETGYVLRPGVLYIGRTVERTATEKYIPMLNGRSSGGRLGISIHVCAGFGDIGFDGTWTLEITVVEPVIIYPNVEIAQVSYFTPCGSTDRKYRGRYYGQTDATASRFYRK